jgi:hypothetical protein
MFEQVPPLRRHVGKEMPSLRFGERACLSDQVCKAFIVQRHTVAGGIAKSVKFPAAALDDREVHAVCHQEKIFLLVEDVDHW